MTSLIENCPLCERDAGVYDFGRVCCTARFIASIPLKHLRTGWMERIKARKSPSFFEVVEGAVRLRWSIKHAEAGGGKVANG